MTAPTETPAPAPAPAPPRYRYFTVPPDTVRLTVDDLIALLPPEAWVGPESERHRELSLATAEILESNFPRIRTSRLRDLLPGHLHLPPDTPEWVALPTDRIAVAYRPDTRRELITDSPAAASEPVANKPAGEPAAASEPIPGWKRVPKPELAPPPARALGEIRLPAEAQARFQNIFMSDDDLPVTRLVELAGGLPGLQGCILVRGADVVRSRPDLARLDAAALTTGALEVLKAMGASSGLLLRPALTVYAESGPVSFLTQGDLRLVVVHRERGFLPGVREKLETLLEALAAAV